MAIALVGSVGAISHVASNAAATPAFGQATTAGNLLVAFVSYNGTVTISATAGWNLAVGSSAATAPQSQIWYKPNCGASETAPTFSTSTAATWDVFLAEFSGASASPLDKVGSTLGTSSPTVATTSAADLEKNDLVLVCSAHRSTSSTTGTFGNTAGYTDLANNGATSQQSHIDGAYQVLTSGGVSADTDSATFTGTVSKLNVVIASFKAAAKASDTLSSFTETATRSAQMLSRSASDTLSAFTETANSPAIGLVSAGGVASGAATVTPAFGQATTAGNLLVAAVVSNTPDQITVTGVTGWQQAAYSHQIPEIQTSIFFKPNCGASETAPTFDCGGAGNSKGALAEFAHAATSNVLDQIGASVDVASPITVTAGGIDHTATELVIAAVGTRNTTSTTGTYTHSVGYTPLADLGSFSGTQKLAWAFRVWNNGGVTADTDTVSFTGATNALSAAIASFYAPTAKSRTSEPVTDTLASFTEAATRSTQTFTRHSTDTLSSLVESPAENVTLTRTASDTLSSFTESAGTAGVHTTVTAVDTLSSFTETATRTAAPRIRTATDTLGGFSESATRAAAPQVRTSADTLSSFTETATRSAPQTRTATDSLTSFTETPTRTAATLTRTATDTLAALTDTATRAPSGRARSATDSLGAFSETATRAGQQESRTATDSLTSITDTATRASQVFVRTTTDTLSAVTETATRTATSQVRSATDSLGTFSESATRAAASRVRTATDTLGPFTETALRSVQRFVRTATDSLGAFTETGSRSAQSFVRTAADTLGTLTEVAATANSKRLATDTLAAFTETATRASTSEVRTAADTLSGFTETPTRTAAHPRTATDNLTNFTESATRAAQPFTRSASESLSVFSESVLRAVQSFLRTATDSLGAFSENAARTAAARLRSAADTLSALTETPTRTTVETRTATDSLSVFSEAVTRAVQSFVRSAADTLGTFSETAALKGHYVATDSLGAFVETANVHTTHQRAISDSLTGFSETATSSTTHPRSATDSFSVFIEAPQRSVVETRITADTLAAYVETVTRIQHLSRTATDPLAAFTESASAFRALTVHASDTLTGFSEVVTRKTTSSRSVSDILAALTETITPGPHSSQRAAADTLAAFVEAAILGSTIGQGSKIPWRIITVATARDPWDGWTAQWVVPLGPVNVVNVTVGTGPAVITTDAPHGLHKPSYPYYFPQFVSIREVGGSGFVNGTWPVVDVLSSTQFTIAAVNSSVYLGGGRVTIAPNPLPHDPAAPGNLTQVIVFG